MESFTQSGNDESYNESNVEDDEEGYGELDEFFDLISQFFGEESSDDWSYSYAEV